MSLLYINYPFHESLTAMYAAQERLEFPLYSTQYFNQNLLFRVCIFACPLLHWQGLTRIIIINYIHHFFLFVTILVFSSFYSFFSINISSSFALSLHCCMNAMSNKPLLPAARSRKEQERLHAAPVTSTWYSSNNVSRWTEGSVLQIFQICKSILTIWTHWQHVTTSENISLEMQWHIKMRKNKLLTDEKTKLIMHK